MSSEQQSPPFWVAIIAVVGLAIAGFGFVKSQIIFAAAGVVVVAVALALLFKFRTSSDSSPSMAISPGTSPVREGVVGGRRATDQKSSKSKREKPVSDKPAKAPRQSRAAKKADKQMQLAAGGSGALQVDSADEALPGVPAGPSRPAPRPTPPPTAPQARPAAPSQAPPAPAPNAARRPAQPLPGVPVAAVASGPKRGWYRDPLDRTQLRWFDGQRWTSTTREIPSEAR